MKAQRARLMASRTAEIVGQAMDLYPAAEPVLSMTSIKCTQKGRIAGKARWSWMRGTGKIIKAEILLNPKAFVLDPDDMLNDTIPHEVAHLVTVGLGIPPDHCPRWQEICIALGGSGKARHSLALRSRMREWKYVATCGTEVWLTTLLHNKVQNGQARRIKATNGAITALEFRGEQR